MKKILHGNITKVNAEKLENGKYLGVFTLCQNFKYYPILTFEMQQEDKMRFVSLFTAIQDSKTKITVTVNQEAQRLLRMVDNNIDFKIL